MLTGQHNMTKIYKIDLFFFIQISDRVHKLDSKVLTEFKSAGHFPIDFYGTRSHRYHPLVAIKNNANTCMLASI